MPTPSSCSCGATDLHHHAILAGYRRRMDEWGIKAQPGIEFPEWTPDVSLRWMDEAGVEKAWVSVGSPGFYFGDCVATVQLTSACNAELAELREKWPERFALYATVPLPDVGESLRQVERALTLDGFEGVGLLTQYGGRLLGSPEWDELYALLDGHDAVVHVHPTIPQDWQPGRPDYPALVEYPFQTTRALLELARNHVFSRFPGIKWIFSHGGGTLAALADRISRTDPDSPILGGDSLRTMIDRSRFDSALVGPAGLAALAMVVGAERIIYGSDLPFVGSQRIAYERDAFLALYRQHAQNG